MRWLCALCLGALVTLVPAWGEAQLTTNHYNIDLFTSPVLGPGRIVGMSGAHIAIATGIDGAAYNPAGYAERGEMEIDFFALDLTGGIWFGGLFRSNDFDNTGRKGIKSTDTLQLTGGMRMQFASYGMGTSALVRLYTLNGTGDSGKTELSVVTLRGGGGYSFLDGGVVIGAGLVMTSLDLSSKGKSLVAFRGFGAEVGALIRPKHKRYRVGATFRSAIDSRPDNQDMEEEQSGLRTAQGFVLPSGVHVPWEVGVGFAYQFLERRSNVPWRNTRTLRSDLQRQIASGSYQPPPDYGEEPYAVLPPELDKAVDAAVDNYREGERRLRRHQPRRYILLAVDFLIYGKTPRGQSMSGFLRQEQERSGDHIAVGLRVGAESEVWQDRMKVRLGSYLEPSRTNAKNYRIHGTLGLDARLFDFWSWSAGITATVDVARSYFNWGLGLGLWW